jgi:hypothetical protein
VRFFVAAGAVFDALRHDEHLAGAQHHIAIVHLDRQFALENQEEVVGVVVFVPHEIAQDLDDVHVVRVVTGDGLGAPVFIEEGELLL